MESIAVYVFIIHKLKHKSTHKIFKSIKIPLNLNVVYQILRYANASRMTQTVLAANTAIRFAYALVREREEQDKKALP
jgi:hypothetical protein